MANAGAHASRRVTLPERGVGGRRVGIGDIQVPGVGAGGKLRDQRAGALGILLLYQQVEAGRGVGQQVRHGRHKQLPLEDINPRLLQHAAVEEGEKLILGVKHHLEMFV